jgi:predicted DsbA family dithiol-disulfide isomerase
VEWHVFPLNPGIPAQGISLAELFRKKGMDVDVKAVVDRLKATAATFNLPMGDRNMVYDTRLAQEAGLWAQSLGRGHGFHDAAFRAYFVAGKNLADMDVLRRIIQTAGLDPEEGVQVIRERRFKTAVDADWALAKEKSITAVPSFLMGLDRLVGAQSFENLEKMVRRYGARQRPGRTG